MPRSFLIRKHGGGGGSSKPKRTCSSPEAAEPKSPVEHQLMIPEDLTPPRTPSAGLSTPTPPPGVTMIAVHPNDNPIHRHEPLNLITVPSTNRWSKSILPPYLPFNFSAYYPAFPQPTAAADYHGPLYPLTIPQRTATLPAEPVSPYSSHGDTTSPPLPNKKLEPLAPLPIDNNSNTGDGYSKVYEGWYSRENTEEISDQTNKRSPREVPRFQCTDCNKSYSTLNGLSKHQQFHCSTQTNKSFACKYCDKVYVSLGALKMHIRTHTLPCQCKLCGKAFSRPWLLQGHIRTHTGEKPFSCPHCNRAFADRSNLRAHLQTHSDVKKYSCKNCSKTFSRTSLLLKHEDGGCNPH